MENEENENDVIKNDDGQYVPTPDEEYTKINNECIDNLAFYKGLAWGGGIVATTAILVYIIIMNV